MRGSVVVSIFVVLLLFLGIYPAAALVAFDASAPQVITKGDPFTVRGSGFNGSSAAVWIIGKDYFDVRTVVLDGNSNFTLTIKPEETVKFPTGKYAVAVQDTGNDARMEIEPGHTVSGNLTIANRGKMIADIGPLDELPANAEPIATILAEGTQLQGVDDTFDIASFFVEEPGVDFAGVNDSSSNQLPAKQPGMPVSFEGTTNIRAGNILEASIRDVQNDLLVSTKNIPVMTDGDKNTWALNLNAPGLPQGEYSLTLGWSRLNTTDLGVAKFAVEGIPVPTTEPIASQQSEVPGPASNLPIPLILTISSVIVILIIAFTTMKK